MAKGYPGVAIFCPGRAIFWPDGAKRNPTPAKGCPGVAIFCPGRAIFWPGRAIFWPGSAKRKSQAGGRSQTRGRLVEISQSSTQVVEIRACVRILPIWPRTLYITGEFQVNLNN